MPTKEQLAYYRERAKAETARVKAGHHRFMVVGPNGKTIKVRVSIVKGGTK